MRGDEKAEGGHAIYKCRGDVLVIKERDARCGMNVPYDPSGSQALDSPTRYR